MSNLPWGLYYFSDNRAISLPLLHVRAAASIKELAAQVKLTHTYSNDTEVVLEAIYSFPIPARAAVCSFVMIKQDGTRVVGHVKEKEEAREIYESAVVQGKQAALMEQQTPDVFKLAVGNIQPHEKVQIELIYATVLSEDEENDSVRFHLPVNVGARYGQAPMAIEDHSWLFTAPSAKQSPFLEIFVDVEAVAPIAKIGCPSHSVSTELGPDPTLPNAQELSFSNYARVSLSSESALDKDFVLTVKSAGLDAPRCIAELHPIHPTVALALSLVPRFKLPDLSRQEFIFLVDRSGSMKGQRIEAAKKALVVMLRSLPAKDSLFQIASFGNACTVLWDGGSRPYNQATLDDATQHVDGMQADYGGTRIREALAHCFGARKTDRPTSVFLLTDGAAWDVDGVLREVKAAVASCSAQAYLRVSVLGIGNSASTAMCEGIARVGEGICMMVGEQETTFTGKIARMLKAARTPLVSGISVDWGVPVLEDPKTRADEDDTDDDAFVMVSDDDIHHETGMGKEKGKAKEKTLDIFDEAVDPMQVNAETVPPPPDVVLLPPPQVQQSPFKIRTLSPANRFNAWAILQGKTVPKAVTLTGFTEDGSQIRLSVPVTLSNLPNAPESPPAIHALAARKIIQDLEDGQHAIASTLLDPDDADLLARTVRASIVRLGKVYSISSSHTSFVAVDDSGPLNPPHLSFSVVAPPSMGNFGHPGMGLSLVQVGLASPRRRLSGPAIGNKRTRSKRGETREKASLTGPSQSSASSLGGGSEVIAQAPSDSGERLGIYPEYTSSLPISSSMSEMTPRARYFSVGGGSEVNAQTFGEPSWSIPESWSVQHCDDAASKETQYLRRKCSTCQKDDSPSWRRSSSDPTKIVCNKCGLLERTQLRARPLQYAPLALSQPAESPAPPTPMDILEALARLQSFDGRFSHAVLSTLQLNVDADQARTALADVPDEVFATVLAMAFLCTKLGPDVERESWEAMYDKARAFVEDTLQSSGSSVGVDELQTKAVTLLA
ncbi:von Willebrand factor type A domain-containing protein [Mycena latifolia]|nr:von Willebrand factor type A domain-containing protein [Mycena latifolia]